MDFELTDEQRQLSDSLERLLTQQYSIDQRKAIIGSACGFSAVIWAKFADLGILSLPVSEEAGGFGGGAVDLMRPMALLGHSLVVEPLIAHLTAARLLDRASAQATSSATASASDTPSTFANATASARRLLEQSVAGEQRLAWIRQSSADPRPFSATSEVAGWLLNGACTGVFGADGAGHLVVTAVIVNGADAAAVANHELALFLVPADTPSVTLHAGRALDNQRIADVRFSGVHLPATNRITASSSDAVDAIDDASDFASALLCAEAVGVIEYACEATLEYLKTRKQFGVAIGTFQALQHRIVDLYVELEQVRSMAALSCSKYDAANSGQVPEPERTKAVAAARVLVGKAATRVAQESVQLHGGMGMAEEMKISHAFRRLTVLAQQYGNIGFFTDRFIRSDRLL